MNLAPAQCSAGHPLPNSSKTRRLGCVVCRNAKKRAQQMLEVAQDPHIQWLHSNSYEVDLGGAFVCNQSTYVRVVCPTGHEYSLELNRLLKLKPKCGACTGKDKNVTLEKLKKMAAMEGWSIETTEYVSQYEPLPYRNPSGELLYMTADSWKRGHRSVRGPVKQIRGRTHETVSAEFLAEGYTLVSHYSKVTDRLQVRCPKNHTYTTHYGRFFYQKARCGVCHGTPRKTLTEVQALYDTVSSGYTVLSRRAVPGKKELQTRVKCPAGHEFNSRVPDFLYRNNRCPECSPKESVAESQVMGRIKQYYPDAIKLKEGQFEIDIFIPSLQLGIEYCGVYWHSSIFRTPDFHLKKYLACKSKGITLLTVFECPPGLEALETILAKFSWKEPNSFQLVETEGGFNFLAPDGKPFGGVQVALPDLAFDYPIHFSTELFCKIWTETLKKIPAPVYRVRQNNLYPQDRLLLAAGFHSYANLRPEPRYYTNQLPHSESTEAGDIQVYHAGHTLYRFGDVSLLTEQSEWETLLGSLGVGSDWTILTPRFTEDTSNLFELREASSGRFYCFFEDEVKTKRDIVCSILQNALGRSKKTGGRNLSFFTPTSSEAATFLTQHHLMGPHAASRQLGLKMGGEILALFSYKISGAILEINRLATAKGWSITGGVSKFLAEVQRRHPELTQVISWVDLRYATGQGLEAAGFHREKITRGWKWTDGVQTYNRLKCRANMDERKLSEKEHAEELGWWKVYDAGQALYRKPLTPTRVRK